jgi:hypothetical protein
MYREWKEIELCWFGDVQRMEGNRTPKRVLYMSLETSPRGRPRNRWQDEVMEVGRVVGGEAWQEIVYNTRGMEEAPENGKESSHSAHGNGMNEYLLSTYKNCCAA